jgi:hypothetical protein
MGKRSSLREGKSHVLVWEREALHGEEEQFTIWRPVFDFSLIHKTDYNNPE